MNPVSVLKLRTALLAGALAATAVTSASQAFAQERAVQVKIPFAFHNGFQQLPAGTYKIDIESDHVVVLRGPHKSAFVITNPTTATKESATGKAVFNRYGDEYFLREVWVAGSSTGQQCVKSRLEKEVQMAQGPTEPSRLALALNQLSR